MDKLIRVCIHSKRILIVSDFESEYVANILLKSIDKYKVVFNYFVYDYDNSKVKDYIETDEHYIIFLQDIDNRTNVSPKLIELKHFFKMSNLAILIRKNKISVASKRDINELIKYKNYDVSYYYRQDKIKKIKERINNKNE